MAVLLTPFILQFENSDGEPLSGGTIETYAAGTTTPKATYTDFTEAVPLPNPIVLDSAGRATIWISGAYKFVLKDALGNLITTTDNVTAFNTPDTASNPFFQSFSGTGAQLAFVLSEDLGTDEKAVYVYVDQGGGKGYDVQNPNAYTLTGTTLTFAVAPAVGVNNIYVFAPLLLLGAVSSAAAAAAASAVTATTQAGISTAQAVISTAQAVISTTQAGLATTAANSAAAAVLAVANKWLFDSSTVMADPGTGDIRFNNATAASVTQLAISALTADTGNPNVRNFINAWDDSNNTPKGFIRIEKDATNFVIFAISAALTDNTTWQQIPVTYVTGAGTLSNTNQLFIGFSQSGQLGGTNVPILSGGVYNSSFTFAIGDAGSKILASNGGAQNSTIPPNVTVPFPIGTQLWLQQQGAGQYTFVAGAGVTVQKPATYNAKTRQQYSNVVAVQDSANVWTLSGDMEIV